MIMSRLQGEREGFEEKVAQNNNGKEGSTIIFDKDLVQINATVIAGLLILLTINTSEDLTHNTLNRYLLAASTIFMIMPFAGSSFWAFSEKKKLNDGARKLTQWGFVVMMVGLIAVLVLFGSNVLQPK